MNAEKHTVEETRLLWFIF